MLRRLLLATVLLVAMCGPSASENLLFILDSSGSMWGKLEGQTKIQTAKSSLSTLIGDLPNDTKVGLMVYGHRYDRKSPDACQDIEVLSPVGQAETRDVEAWLKRIVPKGKTPIAAALQQTADAFVGLEKENNNVVLISDGIETCDGDPCAVAGTLARSNINVRVHVVGFDVSDKDREQLECIAQLGKGKYFPAGSTEGFNKAVSEAIKVAQEDVEPEPTPPPAPAAAKPDTWKVVFEDTFDRSGAGDDWEAINPNPDAFVVEGGELVIVANSKATPSDAEFPNILRMTQPMPEGDWRITARAKLELQRGVERFYIGLYESKDKWLATTIDAWHGHGSSAPWFKAVAQKFSGGKLTQGEKGLLAPYNGYEGWPKLAEYMAGVPIAIRLEKQGRQYIGSVKIDAPEAGLKEVASAYNTDWVTLDKMTDLRGPTMLFVGFAFWENDEGESLAHIEDIKVEVRE